MHDMQVLVVVYEIAEPAQERWGARLAEAEAAAAAKLGRERALVGQYGGTIAELSRDGAALSADLQAAREQGARLRAELEARRANVERLQVR